MFFLISVDPPDQDLYAMRILYVNLLSCWILITFGLFTFSLCCSVDSPSRCSVWCTMSLFYSIDVFVAVQHNWRFDSPCRCSKLVYSPFWCQPRMLDVFNWSLFTSLLLSEEVLRTCVWTHLFNTTHSFHSSRVKSRETDMQPYFQSNTWYFVNIFLSNCSFFAAAHLQMDY